MVGLPVAASPSTQRHETELKHFDITVPHSARLWCFFTARKDCFPADRDCGEETLRADVDFAANVQELHKVRARVVEGLVRRGVRQFLDIGCGLPDYGNDVHDVAVRVGESIPDKPKVVRSRVVYVDNDPMVLAHGKALLRSSHLEVRVEEGDILEPEKILAAAVGTLDFDEPVAVLLFCLLGWVAEQDEAEAGVRHIIDALVSGSYLAVSDISDVTGGARKVFLRDESLPFTVRSEDDFERLLAGGGLEVIDPGIVPAQLWNPGIGATPPELSGSLCGVARRTAGRRIAIVG